MCPHLPIVENSIFIPQGRIVYVSLLLLLLLLSSYATLCHFFFLESGTLFLVFWGIITKQGDGQFTRPSPNMPSSCLRRAFAFLVEEKWRQGDCKEKLSRTHRRAAGGGAVDKGSAVGGDAVDDVA